jgi:catechol 1,2-dioxygenase
MRPLSRRHFFRLTAAGGIVVAGCGPGGPDGAPGPDGPPTDPTCQPTRGDLQGPFFEPGAPMRIRIAEPDEPGERLELSARVLGPDCATPLAGVLIDVWQADRDGNYHAGAATNYRLRGQVTTEESGQFRVETIRPGRYPQGPSFRPAHLHFTFVHPGYRTLTTQIYFAGDPYLAPDDPCATCGSDDDARIVALAGDAAAGWHGTFEIVLAAA